MRNEAPVGHARLPLVHHGGYTSDTDGAVSAASAWEMAVKFGLGKLQLSEPFDVLIPREMRSNGFLYLPIDLAHTVRVVSLPFHHRDPFDRMLVAQALCEQMALVSADVPLDAYGIQRVW